MYLRAIHMYDKLQSSKLLCDANAKLCQSKTDGSEYKKPMARSKTTLYTGYFDLGMQR